jgi:superfamily I DNA and/or RNA helicase
VATSIGAADAHLLAACGIYPEEEDDKKGSTRKAAVDTRPKTQFGIIREFAPDNLPPLKTPFVIIDEACQSVEPASLIPIVSTMSCRSLVMLGDPCQLPPTVKSDSSSTGLSPLSISLMSRLASTLPQPVTVTAQKDATPLDSRFLQSKPTRQAVSRIVDAGTSYKKMYSGSLLLSVQYRMHPSIAAFPSAIFYNGLLSSPLQLGSSRTFPQHLSAMYPLNNGDNSVRFINIGGRNNESNEAVASGEDVSLSGSGADSATSYRNDAEARQIIQILTRLLSKEASYNGSIGIVTPYSGQVALIKTMMARDPNLRALVQSFPHEIEVKSVE